MDLKEDKKQDFEGSSKSSSSNHQIKTCSDCRTSKTPLWRGGPAGPKTLCNACGIKYNKKRRQQLGLDTGRNKNKKNRSNCTNRSNEVNQILKMRFKLLENNEFSLQRSGKLMSKLREEERAAIMLMALSCGSVYA